MEVQIQEEKKGRAKVFLLGGRLDSSTSPLVESKIFDSIAKGENDIILDFTSLNYISSAGIRVLVHCHKELEKKERTHPFGLSSETYRKCPLYHGLSPLF